MAIVELYYFWKTTDRYVKRRRIKLTAQEHKLKQVYIPNYNKPNQSVLFQNAAPSHLVSKKASTGCDSCTVQQSTQWYAWGPSSMLCKLCTACWQYWKKFGGLKTPDASNKGKYIIHYRFPMQSRLEAAANAQKTETNSASSIVPNGNLNINMFGASSINPHKLARKLSLFAWCTVKDASGEELTDYESLLKKMKEIAKEAMKDECEKRSAIISKLENKSKSSGDMKILQCIDKVAAAVGIEFTSEESKAIVKSLKRTAPEDSVLDGPAAKKLA
ncbi:Metastasis-associated protein mta2 [Cichlidogyrus casuarinus]|uniref:Metastasis-associated protein mta2 n=1 Tax=Cichlidogyrus casuarinus TaxID=1844966 RepID=A0ABD2QI21_9PLAT